MLGGGEVAVAVSGLVEPSANVKTGDMLQANIIPVVDQKLTELVKAGGEASVCGRCPRRPTIARKLGIDPCYVTIHHAPRASAQVEKRDRNLELAPVELLEEAGRPIRLGAWGDPCAVPAAFWRKAIQACGGKATGYTHQWRDPIVAKYRDEWRELGVMASADSVAEARAAWDLGLRTFRVTTDPSDIDPAREVVCPAGKLGKARGRKVTCADCLLCGPQGKGAKSVVEASHGKLFRGPNAIGGR